MMKPCANFWFGLMHPVLVFRHSPVEGPAYFTTFLERAGIPWRLLRIDAGEPVPTSLDGLSGLCLMGGPMSVNDPLPWIAPVLARIREAVASGLPVIGHCLGGQLMARALGGTVTRNPVREIGWGEVEPVPGPCTQEWLGLDHPVPVFHWHGETFSIPAGATRLLKSAHCAHQAFVVDSRHLAMQCHVEMTPELIAAWCAHGAAELVCTNEPAVQTPAQMQEGLETRIPALHAFADKIYSRWIQGLTR